MEFVLVWKIGIFVDNGVYEQSAIKTKWPHAIVTEQSKVHTQIVHNFENNDLSLICPFLFLFVGKSGGSCSFKIILIKSMWYSKKFLVTVLKYYEMLKLWGIFSKVKVITKSLLFNLPESFLLLQCTLFYFESFLVLICQLINWTSLLPKQTEPLRRWKGHRQRHLVIPRSLFLHHLWWKDSDVVHTLQSIGK